MTQCLWKIICLSLDFFHKGFFKKRYYKTYHMLDNFSPNFTIGVLEVFHNILECIFCIILAGFLRIIHHDRVQMPSCAGTCL
jgi:hypothetical protein